MISFHKVSGSLPNNPATDGFYIYHDSFGSDVQFAYYDGTTWYKFSPTGIVGGNGNAGRIYSNNNLAYADFYEIVMAVNGTCFRGDTTYVTMYDGAKKLIKDVKAGDSVLGYDVNTRQTCEAIVLRNVLTGREKRFKTYVMDDGSTIDIYGDDDFVFRFDGVDGVITCTPMSKLYEWHLKGSDKRDIISDRDVSAIGKKVAYCFETDVQEITERYSIYTSTGNCFVNGLCATHRMNNFANFFLKKRNDLPPAISEIFEEIAYEYAGLDNSLPDTEISNPTGGSTIMQLFQAKALIDAKKRTLSGTDYKAMKYAEGALAEEEWLPVKELRVEARRVINEQEEIVRNLTAQVQSENPGIIDKEDWQTQAARWRKCSGILLNHTYDFKTWLNKEMEAIASHEEV